MVDRLADTAPNYRKSKRFSINHVLQTVDRPRFASLIRRLRCARVSHALEGR